MIQLPPRVDRKEFDRFAKLWRDKKDRHALSWLYYNLLSRTNPVCRKAELVEIFGTPTSRMHPNVDEYVASDGQYAIYLEWRKDNPEFLKGANPTS